ncbi:MAG: DUF1549 domain-containing protein, partial [Verrucomicrobiales bacterium]|nr:DUF1549 domain-containing protein [Verrucomicrobiales bacterium]
MRRLTSLIFLALATTTLAAPEPWPETFQQRLSWWSLQPVENPPLPQVSSESWPLGPIDHFILADLDEKKLTPADDAAPHTILRRLHFVLTGLPPAPAELETFLAAHSKNPDAAITSTVDALIASPAFAERFARHWMDWVRYADSHGSEGDPAIPHAWRYRDYLVRALDADLPYDQLVREHIAGDLLTQPRIDPETGIDESALATAHYRFVHHGFAPTDALDELVRFTDNQIDVVTKAFQAHTVSCARCHDHKFDAISHKDYYALFGTFAATRPATKTIDTPEILHAQDDSLTGIKAKIRQRLADTWLAALPDTPTTGTPPAQTKPPTNHWQLGDPATFAAWPKHGSAFGQEPNPAGDFHIPHEGDRIISNIFPAGAVSHTLSSKHSAVITSPRFKIPENHVLWIRAAGNDGSRLRYVVQNYPRNGTVYPITGLKDDQLKWHRFDLTYWSGDHAHVEIATAADNPVVGDANKQRSWIAITGATLLPKDAPAPKSPEPPTGDAALHAAVTAWKAGAATDLHAATLSRALADNKLPNSLEKLPALAPLIADYRKTEALVPVPTRAPGVIDTAGTDWPLYERGDHKKPTVPVARSFLSAIDPKPYQTHQQSGRLQLAESILDPQNPLTARV